MNEAKTRIKILPALIQLMFMFLLFYFLSRAIFVFIHRESLPEKILAILFFLSEAFIMFHAVGYFACVWRVHKYGEQKVKTVELKDFPTVAILVPSRHEPKEVLDSTLVSCYNLAYPNKTIYLLDDSTQESYQKEAQELCDKYNARLFRRTVHHGAKAGVINDILPTLKEKYLAVFDADQNPMPSFLAVLIPILEANEKLAFVQTPQFYSNIETNKIAYVSNLQQSVFYEYVCEGKSSGQAMMCCGTNVVFRRVALADVGGFDETTITEDFATSLKIHMKGWESLYFNHVHTFGMGPEDLGAYFKQQNRWAQGNITVFKNVAKQFSRHPLALNWQQWFEYFITGSYYLIGWSYVFLVLCPILYVFFNIPSFYMNPVIYSLTFIPYFVLSMSIYYASMFSRYYSFKDLLKGQLLAFITAPIYMRATIFGLLGVPASFQITQKGQAKRISYAALWPQIAFWAVSLAAITWGLNRMYYERTVGMAVNVFWISYHFAFFSGIFYFNEEEALTIPCKKLQPGVRFEYKSIGEKHEFDRLEQISWEFCFSVALAQKFEPKSTLMCKIIDRHETSWIFDAVVLEEPQKRLLGGFNTKIAVLTISENDKAKLKQVLR